MYLSLKQSLGRDPPPFSSGRQLAIALRGPVTITLDEADTMLRDADGQAIEVVPAGPAEVLTMKE